MKPDRSWAGALLAAFLALGSVGCGPAPDPTAAREVEVGPKYTARNGLSVPEETRRAIDLKVVEVTERQLLALLPVQLRVYRESDGRALASGSVTAAEAKQLRPGLAVRAWTEKNQIAGLVSGVSAQLQPGTGLAEVLVELRGDRSDPVGAVFLRAEIALPSTNRVVAIPRSALLQCSDGPAVYTMSGDYFVRTPVKVGGTAGEFVEIQDGLFAGDQVVLQPVLSLWLTELAAVKGGQSCCAVPAKGK
jgi:hypothetical protein